MTTPDSRFLTEFRIAETTGSAMHPARRRHTPTRRVRRKGFPPILTILLLTMLLLEPALAIAQDTPPTFDDVSAAASAARAQGDLPRAIDLYQQAVQLN